MPELSPAAISVDDALAACIQLQGEIVRARPLAAAALRAAVEQIETLYCDGDVEDSPGIVFALRQLMLIADELEA